MTNRLLLIFCFFGLAQMAIAQPTISSFSPSAAAVGATVTISGTNFSTTAANNIVYFGATRAAVTAATTTQLTTQVPLGATHQPITVTVAGLTAYSADPFIVTFAGTGILDATSFAARVSFATGVDPAYVATGDLDGNGAPDIVTPNNGSIVTTSIFRNLSVPGSISYTAKNDVTVGSNPISTTMGDLDGDGKLDVVVVNNSINTMSILRNTSTPGSISFAANVNLGTGSAPYDVVIRDIDQDGKPDLIVANNTGFSVSVFRNTSTIGTISFAAKVDIAVTEGPVSIAVGDLNEDGKPDMAIADFSSAANKISVFKNISTPGTIAFDTRVDLTAGAQPRSVAVSDLDGDGKADLAVASSGNSIVSVFRNTTSTGPISFASRIDFAAGTGSYSVAIGDIDGDAKPELAVANFSANTVSLFKNNCTPGTIAFASKVDFATSNQPRGVVISDQDSDGKSDLVVVAFASDAFSVLRNTTKLGQSITFGSLPTKTFGDASFTLTGTASSGLTVTYTSSNTSVATISGNTLIISGAGTADITASQAGNATYGAAPGVIQTFTVNKASQTITFGAPAAKTVGDGAFNLSGSASSSLAVTYTSSNTSVATISGSTVTILSAGSTDITASQAGNTNYNPAANVVHTLVVNKANQSITFGSLPSKVYGDANFTLTASASSGLPVTYTSSNTAVAVVTGSTVEIVASGTSTITASQAGNTNYNPAASQAQTLTVNKGNQTITFGALASRTFGDAAFGLTATSSSGLAVTYTSSNTAVATVSGSTVTIVGTGTTTITASQAGNVNYNAATSVPQNLVVNKASQSISFGSLAPKNIGDPAFNLAATASSGLPVSYSSSNPSVATISGNTVTIVAVGTTNITAAQAGNGNYNPATSVVQALIVKAGQVINFDPLPVKQVGDPAFPLSGTASSGLAVTFVSSNAAVATVSGNTVTIVGAGTTTITASQSGDAIYNPAVDVSRVLTVNKIDQAIVFGSLSAKLATDGPFTISASATSGLPVVFASSNSSVATVTGNTVTVVGAGTTTITASQPGDAFYNAASDIAQTLTVNKADQLLTFAALPDKFVTDAPFNITASATSGLPVTLTATPARVTIAGNQATIVSAGRVSIEASQSGNAQYNAAAPIIQSFCIRPATPTVTISGLDTATPMLTSNASTGNQWFRNGTAISGASGNTYQASQAGVYTVRVTVDDCVSNFATDQVLVVTGTLEPVSPTDIRLYPNPSSDWLYISFGNRTGIKSIRLTDLSGRIVATEQTEAAQANLFIGHHASGTYLVTVETNQGFGYLRFIKQ